MVIFQSDQVKLNCHFCNNKRISSGVFNLKIISITSLKPILSFRHLSWKIHLSTFQPYFLTQRFLSKLMCAYGQRVFSQCSLLSTRLYESNWPDMIKIYIQLTDWEPHIDMKRCLFYFFYLIRIWNFVLLSFFWKQMKYDSFNTYS